MESLDDLGRRIEKLTVDPDAISAPVVRLVRPLLASLGFAPKVEISHAEALLEKLKTHKPGPDRELDALYKQAVRELETNLTSVERATVIGERPFVAHAAWLRRLYELLVRTQRVLEVPADRVFLDTANATDPIRLLPPLAVEGVLDEPVKSGQPDGHASRLVSFELGAVDHLLSAANDEGELLGRRRRLLEAARQMLLETSAAVKLDEKGVEARRRYLAREIARLDRLQGAGLLPDVALTHQLREALSRGERQRLHAALVAIQSPALARGDDRIARLAGRASETLWAGRDPRSVSAIDASLATSAGEVFGGDFASLVEQAYEKGRERYAHVGSKDSGDLLSAAETAKTYLTKDGARATLSAALAVDGCFDTGGALIPLRIVEHERRVRAVRHPTPDLVLLPATGVTDIPDAVIEDPRSIVLDLAAGRLLARRFVKEEIISHTRTVMQGEVRVYVLDGSGSMNGPRARTRDALMVAELASLRERATEHAKGTRVVLYYRYFDTIPGPVVRVARADEATNAMTDVLSKVREGGTDIEAALLSSLELVRVAKESDPDLSRGHVVLVTDGEAPVNAAKITAAREAIGAMPVGFSVIAVGQENEALRALVARQRSRGERAFYHFVSDEMLTQICKGSLDQGPALHLPPVAKQADTPEALARAVGEVVEEMASLARQREVEAMEVLDAREQAETEMGMEKGESFSEGEKAKARALYRDRRALRAQFERWFPAPHPYEKECSAEDGESVTVVLATIAEMLEVVEGSELARQADAIDLLERLLPDSQLSAARWRDVVVACPPKVGIALAAVRGEGTRTPNAPRP